MKRGPKPTPVEYSIVSGRFYRKGKRIGTVNRNGYVEVHYQGKTWQCHRLAFHLLGLELPDTVDHWNLNRQDNSWWNLRHASFGQNLSNVGSKRNGLKGAYYDTRRGTWYSRIGSDFLGCFPSEQAAHDAFWIAAQQRYGEFARKE